MATITTLLLGLSLFVSLDRTAADQYHSSTAGAVPPTQPPATTTTSTFSPASQSPTTSTSTAASGPSCNNYGTSGDATKDLNELVDAFQPSSVNGTQVATVLQSLSNDTNAQHCGNNTVHLFLEFAEAAESCLVKIKDYHSKHPLGLPQCNPSDDSFPTSSYADDFLTALSHNINGASTTARNWIAACPNPPSLADTLQTAVSFLINTNMRIQDYLAKEPRT